MLFPRNRLYILIFFLFFTCYAYFYNGGGGNQVARYNQTRSIVQRGTLYVEGIGYPSDDQIKINGHTYSSKAPGNSLLGVPPYALFQGIAWLMGPRNAFWQNWAAHMTTIVSVGIPCALMGLALYLFLVGVGIGPPSALLGATAIGLGTTFMPYATMYFGHALAGAFSFLSFYCLWDAFRLRQTQADPGRRVLYAAFLISAAVITEYPLVITAGVLSLYLLSTKPSLKELRDWAVGGASGILVLLIYNTLAFGHPLALSYLNYSKSERNSFPVHQHGLGGVTGPKLDILKELLWGDTRGILWFAPVLILVIPGLVYLWAKRRDLWREGLVVMALIVGFLIFNAGYGDSIRYWGGANSAGPRHLIPALPFVGIAIGLLLGSMPWLLGGVVLASITVALVITAVMPQVPMLFGKPFSEFLFPYFLNGQLSVHRGGLVSAKLVTQDSIAYNWGKLLGLPGSWSLVPLYAIVLVLLAFILREWVRSGTMAGARARIVLALTGIYCAGLLLIPLNYQRAHALTPEGQGATGTYYTERQCKGPILRTERSPDVNFVYDGEDLRPYPGGFCGLWRATLEVSEPGMYTFQLVGAPGWLKLDGTEVIPYVPKQRKSQVEIELSAGNHLLEFQLDVPVTTQKVSVRWRAPNSGELVPIPPHRLKALP